VTPSAQLADAPMAVANPIWIDVDGDGKVTPAAPYPP
jgi:hypothetical protein